jgi:hypothetical protein
VKIKIIQHLAITYSDISWEAREIILQHSSDHTNPEFRGKTLLQTIVIGLKIMPSKIETALEWIPVEKMIN